MPLIQESSEGKMQTCQWSAPAKVNIFLRITGRRPNGYHDLESLMVPLSLADTLTVQIDRPSSAPGKIQLTIDDPSLSAGEDNLVVRAARAFFQAAGQNLPGLTLHLEKRIPIAAGLGGGSSDAASTLLALNHLCGKPLTLEKLQHMGVALGADVPFFLYERACLARGIGEILNPLRNSTQRWIVLVNPSFAVSTKWVYENLDLNLTAKARGETIDMSEEMLCKGDWETLLQNDLERVTLSKYPQLGEIKIMLKAQGARGSLMSGSGPTVFGIFSFEQQARDAAHTLSKQDKRWKVFVTHTI